MKDKSAETNVVVGETVLSPDSNNIPSRHIMTRVWSPNSAAAVSTGNPYFRYVMCVCVYSWWTWSICHHRYPFGSRATIFIHVFGIIVLVILSILLGICKFMTCFCQFFCILSNAEHRVYVCVHSCLMWSIMYIFITRDSLPDQMLQNSSERVNNWKTYANRQTVYWQLQT